MRACVSAAPAWVARTCWGHAGDVLGTCWGCLLTVPAPSGVRDAAARANPLELGGSGQGTSEVPVSRGEVGRDGGSTGALSNPVHPTGLRWLCPCWMPAPTEQSQPLGLLLPPHSVPCWDLLGARSGPGGEEWSWGRILPPPGAAIQVGEAAGNQQHEEGPRVCVCPHRAAGSREPSVAPGLGLASGSCPHAGICALGWHWQRWPGAVVQALGPHPHWGGAAAATGRPLLCPPSLIVSGSAPSNVPRAAQTGDSLGMPRWARLCHGAGRWG